MKKKPFSIYLLLITFILIAFKNISILLDYSYVTDYVLFNYFGLGALFFVFVVLMLVLNVLSIWYILKPRSLSLRIITTNLVLLSLYYIFSSILILTNIGLAKEAYVNSREYRELTVNEELLDVMISVHGVVITLIITLLWFYFLIFYSFRKQDYLKK